MVKKQQNKRYVQLVEKYGNGRIKKNEQYSIEEFLGAIQPSILKDEESVPKYNWVDKLLHTKKYQEFLKWNAKQDAWLYYTMFMVDIEFAIYNLIEQDD